MNKNEFKKITAKNKKEVSKWSKWKQNITISAETAKTGKFVQENIKECRCNNCMTVYDEDIIKCPKCKTDKYLMQPFIPHKKDKKGRSNV